MIFDGKWKKELKKLSRTISFWSRFYVINEYAMHQLTRAVLYSAIVIRKVIEDEQEAESIAGRRGITLPQSKILHTELSTTQYPFVGEKGWNARGKIPFTEYDEGQKVNLQSRVVCNWLVHSYHWGVASYSGHKKYAGFLVASDFDKEKYIHFISFDEWKEFIELVIRVGKF